MITLEIDLSEHSNPKQFIETINHLFLDKNVNFSQEGNDMIVQISEELPLQLKIDIQSHLLMLNRENLILERRGK